MLHNHTLLYGNVDEMQYMESKVGAALVIGMKAGEAKALKRES